MAKAGDPSLRKRVEALYQLDHLPSQEELLAIAEKWRPYRTVATFYLYSATPERQEKLAAGLAYGQAAT